MKKILLILAIIFIPAIANNFGQSKVLFGLGAGTSNIFGATAFNESIASGGGGFTSTFNIGAVMKFSVPIAPMTPKVYFNYYMLRGNAPGVETSQNIFSIGLSTQFTVTRGQISPYVALDGSYNYFDKFKYSTTSSNTPNTASGSPSNLSSKSRIGGGFAIGADVNVIEKLDLDFSIRYNIMNLWGTSNSEPNLQFLTFNASVLF